MTINLNARTTKGKCFWCGAYCDWYVFQWCDACLEKIKKNPSILEELKEKQGPLE